MGIIGWLVLGFAAGAIAKAVDRGPEPGGMLGTLAVGIVGALVGGFVASALGVGAIGSFFSLGTWLIAVGGAFVLLALYGAIVDRRDGRMPREVQ